MKFKVNPEAVCLLALGLTVLFASIATMLEQANKQAVNVTLCPLCGK
jgi:hypothetical protein